MCEVGLNRKNFIFIYCPLCNMLSVEEEVIDESTRTTIQRVPRGGTPWPTLLEYRLVRDLN